MPVNRHRRGHRLRRRRLLRGGRWQPARRISTSAPTARTTRAMSCTSGCTAKPSLPVRRLLRSRGARGPGLPRAHAADGRDGHLSAVPGIASPIVHHSLIATDRRVGPRDHALPASLFSSTRSTAYAHIDCQSRLISLRKLHSTCWHGSYASVCSVGPDDTTMYQSVT
jgi:hypothetical protein